MEDHPGVTPGSLAWMARLRHTAVCKTRDWARQDFAERQRPLRAAG